MMIQHTMYCYIKQIRTRNKYFTHETVRMIHHSAHQLLSLSLPPKIYTFYKSYPPVVSPLPPGRPSWITAHTILPSY